MIQMKSEKEIDLKEGRETRMEMDEKLKEMKREKET